MKCFRLLVSVLRRAHRKFLHRRKKNTTDKITKLKVIG